MSEPKLLLVPEGLAGERLDAALSRMLGISRSRVADLVDAGHVHVNGQAAKASSRVAESDQLEVYFPPERNPLEVRPEFIEDMRILYDDSEVVVLDKPAGVAVHPSAGYTGPTVVGGLLALGYRITTHGAAERQGVVQRLDVGTSGVMVVAKSERAYSHLKDQFRARTVSKVYHAMVHGRLDPLQGTIDAPIGRHPNHDWKFAVMAGGRESVTHYETVEAMAYASLLEIELETGRTHQIRVHLSALRHPCLGDEMYGADPSLARKLGLSRQWLHAVRLEFEHPASGERIAFESEYSADLQTALDLVREM